MGHRKKKVKQAEYEQVREQATRHWLKVAEHVGTFGVTYKGHVQKVTDKAICFDRLFVEVDYCDGGPIECGREDHVWVEKKNFFSVEKSIEYISKVFSNYEELKNEYKEAIVSGELNWIGVDDIQPDDNLEFFAEAIPYERANGTKEYGLQKIREVHKIGDYELPTDDDLLNQSIDSLVCELCTFRDHCNGDHCLRDEMEVTETFQLFKSFATGEEYVHPVIETNDCEECHTNEEYVLEEKPYELQEVHFYEEQAFADGSLSVKICDNIDVTEYQNNDFWDTTHMRVGIFGIVDSINDDSLKLRSTRIQPQSIIRKDWDSILNTKNIDICIHNDVLAENQLAVGDLIWFSCDSRCYYAKYISDNLMRLDRDGEKIVQIAIAIVVPTNLVKIDKCDYCEQCSLSNQCGDNCKKFKW